MQRLRWRCHSKLLQGHRTKLKSKHDYNSPLNARFSWQKSRWIRSASVYINGVWIVGKVAAVCSTPNWMSWWCLIGCIIELFNCISQRLLHFLISFGTVSIFTLNDYISNSLLGSVRTLRWVPLSFWAQIGKRLLWRDSWHFAFVFRVRFCTRRSCRPHGWFWSIHTLYNRRQSGIWISFVYHLFVGNIEKIRSYKK